MNIQKIFESVESDKMNSPLPLIVSEFEEQGYKVKIEGLEVTAEDLDDNLFQELERASNEINIEINKEDIVQRFKLVFTDYHKFNFQFC